MRRAWLLGGGLALFLVAGARVEAGVIYVDHSATGSDNGTSWEDAYTDLQDAIGGADGRDHEIWVAQGTYKPAGPSGLRSASFHLINEEPINVQIYGGFDGEETSLAQRDWRTNVTILSGDLDGNDGNQTPVFTDNSCHVVDGSSASSGARLDGFKIVAGYADGDGDYANGGGIFIASGSPQIENCVFEKNFAEGVGGAMYRNAGGPTLISCEFLQNSSDSGGGAIHCRDGPGELTMINCLLYGNSASVGGGIDVDFGDLRATNCTIVANEATGPTGKGGGVAVYGAADVTLKNCILGQTQTRTERANRLRSTVNIPRRISSSSTLA